jgi:polar amino acid transport system permease protein
VSDFLGSDAAAASVVLLLRGAALTLVISAAGILAGFAIALPICAARLSRSVPLRAGAAFYVSFFRGVPLLIQLLVIYYLLPFLGLELPGVVAAVIGLAVCTAAYQAENLRGGFLAVPPGQVAAADAFAFSRWQAWRRIVLPQAVRAALPSVVNEMIAILKASSLISVVGVADLMRVGQNIVARTQDPIPWYGLAALLYLGINLGVAALGRRSERILGRGFAAVTPG